MSEPLYIKSIDSKKMILSDDSEWLFPVHKTFRFDFMQERGNILYKAASGNGLL